MKQTKCSATNDVKPIFSECKDCKYFSNLYSKLGENFAKTDFGLCTKHSELVVRDDVCNNFTPVEKQKKEC